VRIPKPTTKKTGSVCKGGDEENGERMGYLNKFEEDGTFLYPAGKRRNVSLPRGHHVSLHTQGGRHLASGGDIKDVRGTYGRA
jgi:hypothetical protein